ncbi:OmpA family protein [Winogradskyella sp. A3E31]|uniref:OmpA family protein n=1 Tax=Winogradskyella sp. A3E31 TaxID=3349637 RepID=UPI00398AC1BD
MKTSISLKQIILIFSVLLFAAPLLKAQTKKIKRPKSKVGISSTDNFVQESFDLYDKVYKYDGYASAGTSLDDDDIDVLEDALDEMTALSDNAPNILSDLNGQGALKQAKATLQINKAKKALNYSIKTAKELLLGQREHESDSESEDETEDDETTEADDEDNNESVGDTNSEEVTETVPSNVSDGLEAYSRFDFVPGDKLLFFDDFSQDFIGDLPSRWNTNGSGGIVKFNKVDGNWLELKPGYRLFVIPDINKLPEDYTIEFDVLSSGLAKNLGNSARLYIYLSDTDKFSAGDSHHIKLSIPFGQYAPYDVTAYNFFNRKAGRINSSLKADLREEVKNNPHISIAVTKERLRLWVNQEKYIDIPRMVEELNVLNYIKFHIYGFKPGEERVFIRNLKVAEGGEDLRRKLLAEGKISTNGILFDSGSSNIQPQSMGIIRQISQVLMQDGSMKLNIIGHTDSDGADEANLKLSKDRAVAVKDALVRVYNISGERLTTEGKGESEPVDDNSTSDGKSKNRRVEFIKM